MERKEAEESIKEIKRMLRETEDEVQEMAVHRADYSILWGCIVIIGLILNMLLVQLELYVWIFVMWGMVLIAGWFSSHRLLRREFRKTGIITFVEKIESIIWIATSISMFLVIILGGFVESFNPLHIPAIIALMAGNAFFISSFLFSDKVLKFSAPIWWIGAIIAFLYPEITFYLFVILILFTMIIPGILIKTRSGEENND